jgi:hypothetical protein
VVANGREWKEESVEQDYKEMPRMREAVSDRGVAQNTREASLFFVSATTVANRWLFPYMMSVGWWKRRKEAEQATMIASMANAFATALGSVLSAQAEQIKQSSAFLGTLQDLSARKAAVVLGSRGGRRSAERKAKLARVTAACPLCQNPNRRGNTLQQIAAHRLHEGEDQERLSLPNGEVKDG